MQADFTPSYVFVRSTGDLTDPVLRELCIGAADRLEMVMVANSRGLRKIADDRIDSVARKNQNARILMGESTKFLAEAVAEHVKILERKVQLSEQMLLPEVRHRLPNGTDKTLQYMREQEIRATLRDRNDLEIRALYFDACEAGNQELVRAIELAPSTAPLVDAATIREGAEIYCEAAFDDAYSLLQQERSALSTVRENASRAVTDLANAMPEGLQVELAQE